MQYIATLGEVCAKKRAVAMDEKEEESEEEQMYDSDVEI